MRVDLPSRLVGLIAALALSIPLHAQQTSGTFRWIDFRDAKDQNIVAWVTRSMQVEKWTAIREIGVVYDAALVVTTDRLGPQSPPSDDSFTVWNVSLTSHVIAPLLKGVNLRWFDWEHFAGDAPQELTVLYDNCHECAASTFFTSFHYDVVHHMWTARWIRGGQGILVWNAVPPSAPDVTWTQVYALMSGAENRAYLCTWNRFDYGKKRQPSDTIFRYDVDPMSGLDRTVELTRDDAEAMKLRLCRGQDAIQGLERGQDSELCQQLLNTRPERKPVTTPPANNRGQSAAGHVNH
ncbi:MAG: hypothetical protein ABSD59_15915 [Terracidiphilus sp.]|jgi:hypothetical protein